MIPDGVAPADWRSARRVLVTGAGGAIGPLVSQAFAAAGWQVRAMVRRRPPSDALPPDVEVTTGDLLDAKSLAHAVAGVDTVVHLAALLHVVRPPASLLPEYERVNVGGTTRLVEAAQAAGVRRLVLASTIAVYGSGRAEPVDESTVPRPESTYAESKLKAEGAAREFHFGGSSGAVVLRLAAVYGARVKGNYDTLVRALDRGRFVAVGRGANRRTLVYERDVARAFVLAAEQPMAAGRTFNVTDGAFHRVSEIVETISAALGRPAPRWHVPAPLAYAAASALDVACSAIKRPAPITRETIDKFLEDVCVSGRACMRDLAFAPGWTLADGWRQAIAERRAAP